MLPPLASLTQRTLTPRQREVLVLISEGCSNRQIAVLLNISENGVKGHVTRLLAKYNVPTRAALVATAVHGPAPAEPQDLRLLLETSLVDVLGRSATALLLRRACRAAGVGEQWEGGVPLSPIDSRNMLNHLWPLLIESTGQVLVRRLQARGLNRSDPQGQAEEMTP